MFLFCDIYISCWWTAITQYENISADFINLKNLGIYQLELCSYDAYKHGEI